MTNVRIQVTEDAFDVRNLGGAGVARGRGPVVEPGGYAKWIRGSIAVIANRKGK